MAYKNQTVYLDRYHYFKVGPLPDTWKLKMGKNPGIIFVQPKNGSRIATEAMCGGSFEDMPLVLSTAEILIGMKDLRTLKSESWKLNERSALYTKANASLDGVPIQINIVVLKKNECEFDFYSIARPSHADQVTSDFLTFVKGFDY
ncbi:MAG: hypothetical protein Q7T03_09755 [Deltaproteobacteria bacterium]|nr:hypothetical protein [Deltaproteobacteria bacterium]